MSTARLSRRSLLAGGALASRLMGAQAGRQRPNILLMMADDFGYECVSANGGTSYKTPNIDALAKGGVRFTHAYAQPLCTPTRVQLMTGQHNFRNWRAFGVMDPQERTFGHMMREAGYKTCIAGKWQLWSYDAMPSKRRGIGKHPKDGGFDEYSLWHAGHTEDKGSRYADPVIFENGKMRRDTKGKFGDDLFADYLGGFMERNRERPFFAYFPITLTHGPFNATPRSAGWARGNRLKDDIRHFGDMVSYLDEVVGRMVRKVDQLGLSERTLILFYSDNGTPREISHTFRGRPFQGGKGFTTRAGMHVPLIASWKGSAAAGRVVDDLVDSTDFIPTMAEATGVKPLAGAVDGRSFLAQIKGERGHPRSALFSHYDPHPGCKVNFKPTRLAWDQRWKLYMDGRLFDVDHDELEKSPLKAGEGGQEAAAARKRLEAILEQMARVKPPKFNEYSAYGAAY